ncbi:TPA: hypothetical protein DCZ57_02115 [Patescibacteria group bacterium]|nr:hypothetical protein [Patescibacteria group bacterium]
MPKGLEVQVLSWAQRSEAQLRAGSKATACFPRPARASPLLASLFYQARTSISKIADVARAERVVA